MAFERKKMQAVAFKPFLQSRRDLVLCDSNTVMHHTSGMSHA
jgi:hypothetical protein